MRATLDWSHELLSDGERALFRRLSVPPDGETVGSLMRLFGQSLHAIG